MIKITQIQTQNRRAAEEVVKPLQGEGGNEK
jgi:hypothetical protein